MSAFIVDDATIDLIVSAVDPYSLERILRALGVEDTTDRRALGKALLQQNVDSVAFRYNEPPEQEMVDRYEYLEVPWAAKCRNVDYVRPREHDRRILGAIHCYRYQSCETPGWHRSLLDHFTLELISRYGDSLGWEWTRAEGKPEVLL